MRALQSTRSSEVDAQIDDASRIDGARSGAAAAVVATPVCAARKKRGKLR
jgi:hypothetical protein